MYMKARGIIDGRAYTVRYQRGKFHYPEEIDLVVESRKLDFMAGAYPPFGSVRFPIHAFYFMYEGLFDELLYFRRDGKEPLSRYRKDVIY